MKFLISICLITLRFSLCAQSVYPASLDSIRLKNGAWHATSIISYNTRAVDFQDGDVVMLRVISEITTAKETLATRLAELLPGSVVSRNGSRWSLRLDDAVIPIGEQKDNRFFSGANVLLNFVSTRAGNFEVVLHFDPVIARWLVVELSGSCGWSSSNGVRKIAGSAGTFQSVIAYESFQFSIGVGVQHPVWTGHVEAVASVGKRWLSSSARTDAGSIIDLTPFLDDVSFVTLRYMYPLRDTSFLLSAGGRYYLSSPAFDGEIERFGVSVGVGLTL